MSNYRFIVVSSRVFSIAVLSGAIAVCVCVTSLLLYMYAVQDVVVTLFLERGRVVSSSCHAVPRGCSVDLEWVRKLEIQDVRRIRKEINYSNLPFGLLECSNN